MNKWEYRTVQLSPKGVFSGPPNAKEIDSELNKYGAEGWEAVSCFCRDTHLDVYVLMKRHTE